MDTPVKTERIHSMDSLRAIMMLLGIVLHSSETYTTWADDVWPKDPASTHIFLNYVNSIIHIFRMPLFFMVAGFFGSMLFYERGHILMIKNRISRIVLPFIVFLLILNPIILLAMEYTATSFSIKITGLPTALTLLPHSTYHLWFLYYLILITFISVVTALLLKRWPSVTRRITYSFEWLIQRRIAAVFLFALVTFLIMLYMWDYWVGTPLFFTPDLDVILFYSLFYFVGWTLFKSKHLLESMMKHDWLFTVLALIMFTAKFIWSEDIDDVLYGVFNAIICWLFVFGISGLFIRYGSKHSARMRYISDASYWVYLVHLPLTILIPGLLASQPISPIIKFFIVLILTSAICVITYHYLVRATLIGKFLNGRRYPIK